MLFYASFVGLGFWMIMFLTQHQLMQKVLFKEIEAAQQPNALTGHQVNVMKEQKVYEGNGDGYNVKNGNFEKLSNDFGPAVVMMLFAHLFPKFLMFLSYFERY